jgi:hypothetical protein
MKSLLTLGAVLFCAAAQAVIIDIGPWTPIYEGVELAAGQQIPEVAGEFRHQVRCLRVDLWNTNVVFFTTPHCTNNCAYETLSQSTSNFMEQYSLQVAVNGGFYASSSGSTDTAPGTPEDVFGLMISKGNVVSPADRSSHAASLLFTTNNQAIFLPNNYPGTNTTGIYTAISGNYNLLIGGTNVGIVNPSDRDPRTAYGLSEDRRYLFLMTIDGRQAGWSDGTDFYNTGEWLKRFGAYDGINVDGGGSTTMDMANCQGRTISLNRSSYVAGYGRERVIGHNFGIYTKPLATDIKDLSITPGSTTALLTWRTDVPATTQVEYGSTLSYGSTNIGDGRLVRNHVATLTGLAQGSNYFFRVVSVVGEQELAEACGFTTLKALTSTQHFGITKSWTYTTNNLDGTNWKARDYEDNSWIGQGAGLLWVQETNNLVSPKNTQMPPLVGPTIPRTYYFRTHFGFSGTVNGVSLIFSNYVDDGAVFYLNGAEIYRLRMPSPPTVILNSTAASSTPCVGTAQQGDAAMQCPDIFTTSGNLLTNLVQGDNVIAVEVHNQGSGFDIVFGSALFQNSPAVIPPQLNVLSEAGTTTLFWNGQGFTLQECSDLTPPPNWSDVAGPVSQSPYTATNSSTVFYRLRN